MSIPYIAPQTMIIELHKQVLFSRTNDETWVLNPPQKYLIQQDVLSELASYIVSRSDVRSSKNYRPLQAPCQGKILVERHRERGIGDLLFLSGPLRWLHDSFRAQIYLYTLANKTSLFHGTPWLAGQAACTGPITYESLSCYDAHWFVDEVTEYSAEPSQLNVYDALFKQILPAGDAYQAIPSKYKTPSIPYLDVYRENLDDLLRLLKLERDLDLIGKKYAVVSPLANASLRSAKYSMWLQVIEQLAAKLPVFVLGSTNRGLCPTTDLTAADFFGRLMQMSQQNQNVINLIGDISLQTSLAVLGQAEFVVTLDSGLLYAAQAFNRPVISLWGTHHPASRIGYDRGAMDLAIYHQVACPHSPCYSFEGWPATKCPRGAQQDVCAPLAAVTYDDVLRKVAQI